MASWQAMVDTSLLGTGFVQKAAIHGLNGGHPWATSAGFAIPPAEAQVLIAGTANPLTFQTNGIRIAGQKYTFVRQDDRTTIGRKGGDSGCILVKTTQALLVGIYEGGVQPGNSSIAVEKLADYLISTGY